MIRSKARPRVAAVLLALLAGAAGCTKDPPSPPARTAQPSERVPREPVIEEPTELEQTPYRASLGHGAELYLPPWFRPHRGGYDLLFHFHGVPKNQEANVGRAHLNVAVVSVNLGAGTDPYSAAFKNPETFERLLADTTAEIEKSGRAKGASVRRIALTAWSAGFVSIAKILADPEMAQRVDAVLLADGFFSSFTDKRRRLINTAGLERFVQLVDSAGRGEKLFAITHTTIPTGPYPSVQECVAKLLELSSLEKTPQTSVGPREMHQFYFVDSGSFHVKGYEGQLAGDHVKQLQAMGETLLPYLKERWDAQDAGHPPPSAARRTPDPPQPRSSP